MRGQGSWLSVKFYFAVFGRRQGRVQMTRKKTSPMSGHLDRSFFLAGPKREIPKGLDRSILPARVSRVANPNTGFASPWPQAEPQPYNNERYRSHAGFLFENR